MSSTIRIPAITLYECNTEFVAVYPYPGNSPEAIGKWLLEELVTIHDYCSRNHVVPCIHVVPLTIDQYGLDKLEIDELLFHCDVN